VPIEDGSEAVPVVLNLVEPAIAGRRPRDHSEGDAGGQRGGDRGGWEAKVLH
jgi:hypothetical protein